jgi:hypothetical protein
LAKRSNVVKTVAKMIFGTLLMAGTTLAVTAPAAAGVDVGISFGWYGPGYVPFGDPCAYYDYYDEAPPWGLPPDYCDYPVYFGTVFWDGTWYRGPIYYRWYGGERMFWLNGSWRRDGWRGGRPPQIRWRDRGGMSGFGRDRDRGGFAQPWNNRDGPSAGGGRADRRPRYFGNGPDDRPSGRNGASGGRDNVSGGRDNVSGGRDTYEGGRGGKSGAPRGDRGGDFGRGGSGPREGGHDQPGRRR